MISLQKLLLRNTIISVFISIGFLYFLWIHNEYSSFIVEAESIKSSFVAKQKERLQQDVQNILNYIQYMRKQTEKRLKNSIKTRVHEAYHIALNIYNENAGFKSDAEIKKMIKDALRPIRFNNGQGYFFAFTMDGIEELFADRPEMEGKNMLAVQGSKGEFVVKDMIKILLNHREGFYSYTWSKPNKNEKDFKKIAFVKYFEPYGWGIGTGEYVDDTKAQIQNEVLERVSEQRFGKEGYFFGSIYGGNPLFADGNITRGTKSIWDLTDPNGVKLIQEQNIAAKKENGGFVYYTWQKINSEKLSPKISYVKDIPEWEWIIGAGMYLDTIDASINKRKEALYNTFIRNAILSFVAMIIMSGLIYLWTRYHIKKIQTSINIISAFFEKASSESTYIEPDTLQFEEFGDIAVSANKMLKNQLQAMQALQLSEKKHEAITNSAQDFIFIKNINRQHTFVNPALANLFKRKVGNLIGKTPAQIYDPVFAKVIMEIDNRTFNGECINEITTAEINGKKFAFHTVQVPLEIIDGKVISISGIVRDITELKQIEKEKRLSDQRSAEQEKHALVGRIAGEMAHDFNNILGIIMGNAQLSLVDCKEDKIIESLQLIFEQTIRGKNLTKNLVAFAKNQEPKQEFFRIDEKIDLVLNLLKKDLEGIGVIKKNQAGLPDLLADSGMIEHALVNLLQNSIHALSRVDHPEIMIRTYLKEDNICFEIEDNGCGIHQKALDHIYEPSFTLKGTKDIAGSYKKDIKGTGYGMANVKKYIEQHKGSIIVDSIFGSGTKFTICLPVIKKQLTNKEKAQIRKEKAQFKKNILLVEDEQAISDIQYRVLTQDPCNNKVDIANTGKAAMDLFGKNEYDFVSMDYFLSKNITGMDVYHHIRKTNKTIPILFVSGNIEFLESIKELKRKDAHIVDGHVKLSQKWSLEIEPLGN